MHTETATLARIYRPRALAALIGVSTATIWRMRRRGEFPPPIQLSPGAVGWPADLVARWIAERAEAGGR